MSIKQKEQTPAQRVANPVWLREQIQKLIDACTDNIAEDQKLINNARDTSRDRYLTRVESHRHWKRQLERILRGKTLTEELIQSWEKLTRKDAPP
jgi:heme oxygenase